MAQNLQGISYEVCFTNVATILRTRNIHSSFWNVCHYTPSDCCYATMIYEIRLYQNHFLLCSPLGVIRIILLLLRNLWGCLLEGSVNPIRTRGCSPFVVFSAKLRNDI